jgi:hypothetical protein
MTLHNDEDWTDDEDALLIQSYERIGPHRLSQHMPTKSVFRITRRAGKLGLVYVPRQPLAKDIDDSAQIVSMTPIDVARRELEIAQEQSRQADNNLARAYKRFALIKRDYARDVNHQRKVS